MSIDSLGFDVSHQPHWPGFSRELWGAFHAQPSTAADCGVEFYCPDNLGGKAWRCP